MNRFDVAIGKKPPEPAPEPQRSEVLKGQKLVIEITGFDRGHCLVTLNGGNVNPSSVRLEIDKDHVSLEMEREVSQTDGAHKVTTTVPIEVQLVEPEQPYRGGPVLQSPSGGPVDVNRMVNEINEATRRRRARMRGTSDIPFRNNTQNTNPPWVNPNRGF